MRSVVWFSNLLPAACKTGVALTDRIVFAVSEVLVVVMNRKGEEKENIPGTWTDTLIGEHILKEEH